MKQIALLVALSLAPLCYLSAQACVADSLYADSSAGVYPKPYEADLNPSGGITKCAVIGEFFQFDLTIVIGDTLTIGAFSFPLDSIIVTTVEGLPQGISHACTPSNCHYVKNTIGCAAIYGTPTAANAPGDYDLKIKGSAFINGSSLPLPLEFPNAALAPGKYTITLNALPSDPCIYTTSTNDLQEKLSVRMLPNPASDNAVMEIQAGISGDFELQIASLYGQVMSTRKVSVARGENRLPLDVSALPNGLYAVLLKGKQGILSQPLSVQR
jgi:hypothetical protein